MRHRFAALRAGLAVLALTVAGCATQQAAPPASPADAPEPAPAPRAPVASAPAAHADGVIARSDRFVIYGAERGDTLESIAARFLGSDRRAWEIADFNGIARVEPGQVVAVPLRPVNPKGVRANGYQTVPILCYHRFGTRSARMIVTGESFERQLEYLARNNYRVIRLADLPDFLDGKRALPERAVVITVDDGHVSAYQYAFPLLKKYGFPATFFMYSDFMGAREGMSWAQIREMADSGLIDFQSHSKTHSNLTLRLPGESDQRYRERLDAEIRTPRDILQKNLPGRVVHYAYPYGDANEIVLERMTQADYRVGVTVNPGGNAFFAHPLMLKRTMVFGEHTLEQFRGLLQVFREQALQ